MSLSELSSRLSATPIFSYRVTATLSISPDSRVQTKIHSRQWITLRVAIHLVTERKSCVVCIPRYCKRDQSWKLVLRTRWILNFNALAPIEWKKLYLWTKIFMNFVFVNAIIIIISFSFHSRYRNIIQNASKRVIPNFEEKSGEEWINFWQYFFEIKVFCIQFPFTTVM